MEKLELLSHTAVLKQGMDWTDSSASVRNTSSRCEKVVLVDNNNRIMMGIPIISQTQHLLAAAEAAATAAVSVPSIGSSGDRRSRTTSPSIFSINRTPVVGTSNLASPISTDGEDEDDVPEVTTTASIASGKSRHNLHSTKARIIESRCIRSPITTVEYAVPLSSPFPSSPPPSDGFGGFLPNHNSNHNLYHQEQQEHSTSYFHNHNGNIIRTLSEASFAPLYASNSMPTSSHSTATRTNNSESETAFHPPQQQAPPPRLHLQQRRHSSPSQEDMARQIREMREQLSEKDMVVSSLQHRVNYLENQIHELRQLPTGKVSHIPVE